MIPSIELGYQFNIKNRLFVSPFIGISGQLFSSSYKDENVTKDIYVKTPLCETFTIGINTDLSVFNIYGSSTGSDRTHMSSILIRFRFGMSDSNVESQYSDYISGPIFFLQIGAGAFGRGTKRIY